MGIGIRADWECERRVAKPVVVSEDSKGFGLQRHSVNVVIVPVEGYHGYLVIKSKG